MLDTREGIAGVRPGILSVVGGGIVGLRFVINYYLIGSVELTQGRVGEPERVCVHARNGSEGSRWRWSCINTTLDWFKGGDKGGVVINGITSR